MKTVVRNCSYTKNWAREVARMTPWLGFYQIFGG